MDWKIPLFKIAWDEEDINAVAKVIRRGTFWANGPEVTKFEKALAEYNDRKFALTFNSGTTALYSLFEAYDLKSSEIIIPSFTFIATANTILLAGGKPVFAEVEHDSFGLIADDVNERITNKTKAIVPVHIAGQPCKEIKGLMEIAEDNNLLLLEDAAQSFGSYTPFGKTGNFGQAAMFSLCQNKAITTGEGGFIVLDDKTIYEKLKLIRSHGRVEQIDGDYFSNIKDSEYIQIGYNFRMPSMLAALGSSQLSRIGELIKKRRENANYLSENLKKIKELIIPKEFNDAYHVYQMYIVKVNNYQLREKLQQHLKNKGIMTKVYFNPIHLKHFYRETYDYMEGDLPRTENLSQIVLDLPMYANLTQEEMDYLIESIKEVLT